MNAPHVIRFDEARSFLVDAALPLWTTRGAYDNGCFVEHFDLAANPVDPGYTRIRAQARQIYVLCHAEAAGLFPSRPVADRAIEFFIRSAWLGPDHGWARRISRHGVLIDPTSDLYDISFALFALAWRHRVAPDPRLLAIAHQTLDFLDARMRHPQGGFHNDSDASTPRQQNPHMHLTEAMNAWFEASGDARFVTLAGELVGLLEQRLTDPRTGALGEFFDDDWTPVAGLKGDIVGPGHQFEWAWIVGHYGRLSGKPRPDLMRRLIASGLRHGYDEATGLTIDQVGRDGRPIATSRRLWPQTEALKAMLAAGEFLDAKDPPRVAAILSAILDRFLKPAPEPGTWIDHFDANGAAIVDKIPATSLYHVALAFLDLLRLRPAYSV